MSINGIAVLFLGGVWKIGTLEMQLKLFLENLQKPKVVIEAVKGWWLLNEFADYGSLASGERLYSTD